MGIPVADDDSDRVTRVCMADPMRHISDGEADGHGSVGIHSRLPPLIRAFRSLRRMVRRHQVINVNADSRVGQSILHHPQSMHTKKRKGAHSNRLMNLRIDLEIETDVATDVETGPHPGFR